MHVSRKLFGLALAVVLTMLTASVALADGGNNSISCSQRKIPGCVLTSLDGINVYYNGQDPSETWEAYEYGYKWQCVELIQRYYAKLHGYPGIWAPLYAYQAFDDWGHPDTMAAYPNGSATTPQKGDVLVFAPAWGDPSGHVALVKSVQDGQIAFVQQNVFDSAEDSLPINADNVIDSQGRYGRIRGWLHDMQHPKGIAVQAAPMPESPVQKAVITLESPELVQLQIATDGSFRIEFDGRTMANGAGNTNTEWVSIPAGRHTVTLFASEGSRMSVVRDSMMETLSYNLNADTVNDDRYR